MERERCCLLLTVLLAALLATGGCTARNPAVVSFVPKDTMGGFDAVIHVSGATWPGGAFSLRRSVERVKGVESAIVDLKRKRVNLVFEDNQSPTGDALWESIHDAGFTPLQVDLKEAAHSLGG